MVDPIRQSAEGLLDSIKERIKDKPWPWMAVTTGLALIVGLFAGASLF